MEAALKLARQYFVELRQPERTHFIAREQSYHGNTLGALGASGHFARRTIYEPILAPNFSHVSPCFPYHYQFAHESDQDYVSRLTDELDAEFQRIGPQRVIAFCVEPVGRDCRMCHTGERLSARSPENLRPIWSAPNL